LGSEFQAVAVVAEVASAFGGAVEVALGLCGIFLSDCAFERLELLVGRSPSGPVVVEGVEW